MSSLWTRSKALLTKEAATIPDMKITDTEALDWGRRYNLEATSLGLETIKITNPVNGKLLADAYLNIVKAYGMLVVRRQKGVSIAREPISGMTIVDSGSNKSEMQISTKSRPSDRVTAYDGPTVRLSDPELVFATRGKAGDAGLAEYLKGTNLGLDGRPRPALPPVVDPAAGQEGEQ